MLEYDDARSGSFGPLKDIPEDKFVVLGLVTTKRERLETVQQLKQRVSQAGRYVPLERLGLSPQCGFASSVLGNTIIFEDQRRKLELVVEAAKKVWA